MTSILSDFISIFNEHGVDAILIGGWAAILHGSSRSTIDVDFVYSRVEDNIERLVTAFTNLEPYLRGAPKGLPFRWDQRTISTGLNFTLTTNIGAVDLFGEVVGGGDYKTLLPFSQEIDVQDNLLRCVTLERLIQLKRAAGRPKDLEAIAELQAILKRLNDPRGQRRS